MLLKEKKTYPILLKCIFVVIMICLFGLYLFQRGLKEKKDFLHYRGQIVYYSALFPAFQYRAGEKYLQIDSYNRVFNLFDQGVNSDSLYFFKTDEISLGDTIDIYFDENSFEKEQRVNLGMVAIDKNDKPIFVHIRSDKAAGIGFIIVGIGIMIGLIILRAKNLIT
jgi:hypothetical protein